MNNEQDNPMQLSIIVPVYNMESKGLLDYCMNSLVKQTFFQKGGLGEIIAVDDASTDSSLASLYLYKERYPRIVKVIARERNGRQGAARNDGLKIAKGKWIGFVDADDWVDVTMYEKLILAAEKENADLAGCQYKIVYSHNASYENDIKIIKSGFHDGIMDEDQIKRALFFGDGMWNKIYLRNNILENHLFFPENQFYEDNAISSYLCATAKKYSLVDEALYYYYQNLESTCNTIDITKIYDRLKAVDTYMEVGKRLGFFNKYRMAVDYGYFRGLYILTVPHIWKRNFREQLQLLSLIRKKVNTYIPYMEKNSFMIQYSENRLRELRLLRRSPALLILYHRYHEWKKKLINKEIKRFEK